MVSVCSINVFNNRLIFKISLVMKQYLILFLVLCFGLVGNPCYAQKAKPTARPRTTQVKQPVNKELSLLKGGKIVTYTFTEVL